MTEKAMPWRQVVAIALPNYGQDIMRAPATTIVQMIYANFFGVPLELIAMINLIGGLFDAFTDPAVGVISDRYYRKHRTRKPFLMAGTVIAIFGMWFMYNPGDEPGAYRFLIFYLIYYLGWTILEIPYNTWKATVTRHYQSRTRIAAVDIAAAHLGIATFGVIPLLLGNGEYTPETLQYASWIVLVVLPPLVLIAIKTVPDGHHVEPDIETPNIVRDFGVVFQNRAFVNYLLLYMLTLIIFGMSAGVGLFYASNYLDAAKALPLMTLYATPVALVSLPLWTWLVGRMEKHRAWAIGVIVLVTTPAIADVLLDAGSGAVAIILPLALIQAAGFGGTNVAVRAMIGDVIDYGKLRNNVDNSGLYVAVASLAGKIGLTVSSSLGLLIASQFGFDASAGAVSGDEAFGLRLAYAWIPLVLGIAAIPAILAFPITRHRHSIICAALARREQRRETKLSTA